MLPFVVSFLSSFDFNFGYIFCILDCTAPFSVQIVTDALTDKADATTANDVNNSRG